MKPMRVRLRSTSPEGWPLAMHTESVMRRLSEADPAREAVPASEASDALLARILSDASDERQFRHAPAARRHRAMSSRALLAVALPALGVVTLVLVIAGVFSGPASTGTQPAAAGYDPGRRERDRSQAGNDSRPEVPRDGSVVRCASRRLHVRERVRNAGGSRRAELARYHQRAPVRRAQRGGRQRRRCGGVLSEGPTRSTSRASGGPSSQRARRPARSSSRPLRRPRVCPLGHPQHLYRQSRWYSPRDRRTRWGTVPAG